MNIIESLTRRAHAHDMGSEHFRQADAMLMLRAASIIRDLAKLARHDDTCRGDHDCTCILNDLMENVL